ncbi:MAG: helix-turn-helix domain-containing protein [Saprospiraceae bacterium]
MFAVFGYRGTTVSQIAAKAGISKGLLYNYFSGKEELLHEIIRSSIAENISWVQAIYDMDLPAFEKLERLVVNL